MNNDNKVETAIAAYKRNANLKELLAHLNLFRIRSDTGSTAQYRE